MPHTTSPAVQKMHQLPLRIVLGGDDAGFDYKAALIADLSRDPRVVAVMDVGPFSSTDTTAYPHYAVAAARKVCIHHSSLPLPFPSHPIRIPTPPPPPPFQSPRPMCAAPPTPPHAIR